VSSSDQPFMFLLRFLLASFLVSGVALPSVHAQNSGAQKPGPQQLFEQGEAALKAGHLEQAERSFRGVLAVDPQVAGAYANLGVINMRRKHWPQALEMLNKAEHLAPKIAGIRLNIGLAYYRQNKYRDAIPPFESVVRDAPDSVQARYLLGLCYFFTVRYADAATTLEPIWPQESNQLNYLYVLGIAANKAKHPELEQRALSRLVETGQNSPEFHLLMGKAHLNREEYDDAISELEAAGKANPKLPFVHFELGLAYMKKEDFDRARPEFLADLAIEPDLAYDYDQLGLIDYLQQHDQEAVKNLGKALHLDSQLASSHFNLARAYQRLGNYTQALTEIDTTEKLDPDSYSIHYVRGQVLRSLRRTEEAQAEMRMYTKMANDAREKRHQELEAGPTPNPEVIEEPK
jgi:tetratricopeptide (TPR) repeat protein